MSRNDPAQLEREAEELMRQHGLIPEEPAKDTPPKTDEPPAPQADTGEQQPPATDNEPDRGDQETSVDDEREIAVLRERYKNAQAAMTKATQRASEAERGIADRDHTIAGLRTRIAELESSGGGTGTPGTAAEAEESIQQALKEYPEIVGPLLARIQKAEATAQSATTAIEQRTKDDALTAHLSAIRDVHSDLDTIANSPDFLGWVARQTPTWQQVAQKGSSAEVIELLDRYKEAVGIEKVKTPQRETAIERARRVAEPTLPRGRKPDPQGDKRQWTRAEIQRMPLDEYEKHREDIDRAYLEGRVR